MLVLRWCVALYLVEEEVVLVARELRHVGELVEDSGVLLFVEQLLKRAFASSSFLEVLGVLGVFCVVF